MKEEEKQAVENIKTLEILFEIDNKKDFEATPLVQKEIAKDLNALLNLIEKLQKENEELKRLMAHKNGYTKLLEEDLFENCSNYVIPIQKVKDKISERQFELQQEYKDFEDDSILIVLQELLEGRK